MDKFTITITSDKPISVKVTESPEGTVKSGLHRLSEEIRNAGGESSVHKQKKTATEVSQTAIG